MRCAVCADAGLSSGHIMGSNSCCPPSVKGGNDPQPRATKPHQNGRIVGGSITNIATYPFMASLRFYFNQGYWHGCGGVLVTNTAVLSTASCLREGVPHEWQVRLGSHMLMSGGTLIYVQAFIPHSNFDIRLLKDDIQVIKLRSAAPLSNTLNIARIAGPNYALPDGLRVYTAGWGITAPFSGLSLELRHVDVRVINHALCTSRYADLATQEHFETIPPVGPGHLCTGLLDIGGQDACSGDDGGPVIHKPDVLVGLTAWAFGCAKPHQNGRIVGGSITNIATYPFMASLRFKYYNQDYRHACGGVLVTNTALLSTASCLYNQVEVPHEWQARLGSDRLLTGGISIFVREFIPHSNFNIILLRDDIQVIKLRSAAPLSSTINIARIAGPNYALPDGLQVYTAGWGITSQHSGFSNELRHVDVRIINHDLCTSRYADLATQEHFETVPPVGPGHLCTGLLDIGGQDACNGDDGGPVIHKPDVLVGLTGWAISCGDAYYPRKNTRVPSYSDWIVQNTQ
ncbi:coagulation factor X-like [Bicyclus anynana]|uniref:Coagulation factor X-like n=1 Tax=Bicyclus anynana TaxID=110368 RepID=A0ABM3LQY8_BICAN|nr:coagulation factor X-like [Bicyclus anynana]